LKTSGADATPGATMNEGLDAEAPPEVLDGVAIVGTLPCISRSVVSDLP